MLRTKGANQLSPKYYLAFLIAEHEIHKWHMFLATQINTTVVDPEDSKNLSIGLYPEPIPFTCDSHYPSRDDNLNIYICAVLR